MQRLGWERIRTRNHAMAVWAHQLLLDHLGLEPLSPRDGSALGSMATIRLPGHLGTMSETEGKTMGQRLYSEHGIEAPLFWWDGAWHLRVACAAYNEAWEYEKLADVLAQLV
jgi:isopenicillin-N epimerase